MAEAVIEAPEAQALAADAPRAPQLNVRSIAAAIGEQSATTQEIARATGAAATEVLCSASGLAAQARRLRQEVAQLLADIDTV